MRYFTLPLLVVFFLVSCGSATNANSNDNSSSANTSNNDQKKSNMNNSETVKNAIQSFVDVSGDFLILEEAINQKYVQFIVLPSKEILVDCPTIQMSEEQKKKATEVLAKYGATLENAGLGTDDTTFNINAGTDVDKATEITLLIFTDVFGVTDDVDIVVVE